MKKIKEPEKDNLAIIGFILGIACIFFGGFVGMLPIITIIISGFGISNTSPKEKDGRVFAVIGLILGILYFIVYLKTYGYIVL